MSIFGATDAPISDFWWRLLWVSKPEWAALVMLGGGVCVTHSLRFTSDVTPADPFVASISAEQSLSNTCEALVRLKTGSYHAVSHSVRSGRCSTNWAILTWLTKVMLTISQLTPAKIAQMGWHEIVVSSTSLGLRIQFLVEVDLTFLTNTNKIQPSSPE